MTYCAGDGCGVSFPAFTFPTFAFTWNTRLVMGFTFRNFTWKTALGFTFAIFIERGFA